MMKLIFCMAMVWLFLAFCPGRKVHAGMFKESWYMSRGKANMKIKNYKAAIEAFEKLLAINPNNREAMRQLGLSYELQGLTDKAIEHYDRYLKRFPDDAEIAFKQAHYLEDARFSYRKEDAIQYYRMGLTIKSHHESRHRLAKLLAGDKTTLDEALAEYKILIKNKPHDVNLKKEYRTLLIWDDRYLSDAIKEYEKEAGEYPDQFPIQHQLARLYYKDSNYTSKAIELYEKLVNQKPANMDLRTEYAKALAKSDRHFNQATEQFQIVLKERNDYETRLAYADHLAGNKSTFEEARKQYEQLLHTNPKDAGVRLKIARLLGAHFETIDSAITHYHILIKQNPGHSAAHRELAAAYAWRGDNDRAIYHSKRALRYNSQDKAADRIKDDLMKGREPKINTGFTYLTQVSDDSHYDYSWFSLNAGGNADITPFLTAGAEIGVQKYCNDETDVDGTFYKLSLQGRVGPTRRIDAEWKYHDLQGAEDDAEFLVHYSVQNNRVLITSGIRRDFKYDSLLAIMGERDEVSQRKIGSARSNTAFCRFAHQNERIQASAMPYLGYVSADSTSSNPLVGADADALFHLFHSGACAFSTFYKLQIYHYDKDNSGFIDNSDEPYAGGYFSPALFINNVLHLKVSYQLQGDRELHVSVGPSFQYTQGHSGEDEQKTGADLDLAYHVKLKTSLHFMVKASYYQIAEVYRRYALTAHLSYTF
ncbi:MAG: tetratricopeptide repeat protein [bacterium]